MREMVRREFVYIWYYFDIQFRQIVFYWILGMARKAMAESTLKDLRIKKEESGGDKSLASQIEVLRKQLGRYNKQKF